MSRAALRYLPYLGARSLTVPSCTPVARSSSAPAALRFSTTLRHAPRPHVFAPSSLVTPIHSIRTYSIAAAPRVESEKGHIYRYTISVAFSAKQKKFSRDRNVYRFHQHEDRAVLVQEQQKLQVFAGQDAFFVSRMQNNGAVAVGVADGVGGYDEAGINSADFSQGLCHEISIEANNSDESTNPQTLLSNGYKQILHKDKIAGGASTASVGVLKSSGKLSAANLGDSGFMIIRHGKIVYSSPPQTHYFNCPLQLSVIPKAIRAHIDKFGGSPYSDSPQDAQVTNHDLQNGDVVIFATDGVWDNLSNQDLLNIISEESTKAGIWQTGKDGIAPAPNLGSVVDENLVSGFVSTIVEVAKSRSHNTQIDGPFAKEVQRLYPGENYHGGKVDDICAICAVVIQM